MNISDSVTAAHKRISSYIVRTPLIHSRAFSDRYACQVYFKLESHQHTGSFKLRGAFNKLLGMDPAALSRGVVAASSGNHGAAVSFALDRLDAQGLVFVPKNTSSVKLDAIRRYGAQVREFGVDGIETEIHAREYAAAEGMPYISPYNDTDVIAGQGTIGLEIREQIEYLDAIYMSVGGGGLIGGVASYLKDGADKLVTVGCLPANSPVMAKSIEAGHIIEMPFQPTLSDGTAGGIETDALTFDLCKQNVDHFYLVSEQEIEQALRDYIDCEHMLLEGAAAVAVAAFQKNARLHKGESVVIIICGANISRQILKRVM